MRVTVDGRPREISTSGTLTLSALTCTNSLVSLSRKYMPKERLRKIGHSPYRMKPEFHFSKIIGPKGKSCFNRSFHCSKLLTDIMLLNKTY
ncbi:hypothetical protein OWR28_12710 [Chryseobacterium sp. 1B4]